MINPDNELVDYNDFCEVRVVLVPTSLGGKRLDIVLQHLLPEFSRSRMQRWLKAGNVRIADKVANAKTAVCGGETLTVFIESDPATNTFTAESIPLTVVYEDESIIILNKPAGLVVHPGRGNWAGTLLNGLLAYLPKLEVVPRAGIVHRLDKDTSGLMVVAKTITAQTHLIRQLQARTVNRHYIALVEGRMVAEGVITAPIGRHPRERTKMAVTTTGKLAKTYYKVQEQLGPFTLIECRLATGRTHQIRVHMHSIGHPLAGDLTYRGKMRQYSPAVTTALQAFNRQALHAFRLGFIHPESQQQVEWEVPLAADMQILLEVIRGTTKDTIDRA